MEKKLKIGVMGGQGSFSEEAANFYCQNNNIANYEIEYLIVADRVLNELGQGKIDLAVFPVHNSISGIVIVAFEAMAKYNFQIKDYFAMDIRQNLLVKDGANLAKITTIVSQIPALTQCEKYILQKWPNVEVMEYSDTAQAARDIAEGKLPSTAAAIANKSCAELYGLKIVEENIQDNKHNKTTFIVASRSI